MSIPNTVPALQPVARPLNLIPVGLKEAALDSPTFRATAVHFADQVELVEKWLDSYIKATLKLLGEVSTIEELVNTVIIRTVPPVAISEAVFDHDYTLIASRRAAESARELWSATILALRGTERRTVEPIKSFVNGELRNFKDARRYLDMTQKNYDSLLSRYASQSKAKEPSALREDAFQLHEARKQYLKASMDFSILAPQVRSTLDRLLIKIFADQYQSNRKASDSVAGIFTKWNQEMRRIKAWNSELELSEKVFRKELQGARKGIEEDAEVKTRPSRELDDYAASTVAFIGSRNPGLPSKGDAMPHIEDSERQGWLFLKSVTGKPARTTWTRKWFYVQGGIFGWLAQGSRTGGVEESEKIGVFLCNVKAAFQEDRRFCFEVKTKDSSMVLQAETQTELTQWIAVFEAAKRRALEIASSAPSTPGARMNDSAFAISQPAAPEFAAHSETSHDEPGSSMVDRSLTLPAPDREGTYGRSSFDTRRPGFSESEGAPDRATRIIQKLDIHRKPSSPIPPPGPSPALPSAGGIASLISASHTILPVHSTGITAQGSSGLSLATAAEMNLQSQLLGPGLSSAGASMMASSLAPSTLANPPASTNMSKTAVIVGGGRGLASNTDIVPSGLMANLWGTHNWAYVNRLESSKKAAEDTAETPTTESEKPLTLVASPDQATPKESLPANAQSPSSELTKQSQASGHRKTQSLDVGEARGRSQPPVPEQYPPNYPLALKTQDAQFRMFFPEVPREDKLLLVFRATWNPNGQQEFPGRVYVTSSALFFYSHHLGLVLVSTISLGSIAEVKATPGEDADYLFVYLKEGSNRPGFTRLQVKVFLEPLRLLQRRLNLLIDEFGAEQPLSAEELIDALLKLEKTDDDRSPSLESWEDVSISTPLDGPGANPFRHERDLRTAIHIDKSLEKQYVRPKEFTKFRLPAHPVIYEPQGMTRLAVERNFDLSPKALFHIMFGDRSAIFQALYHERQAKQIRQGPWHSTEGGIMKRDFNYEIDQKTLFSKSKTTEIIDHQLIERMDDHLCYVIADEKTGWHLPHQEYFTLLSRIVITYVTKSKCLFKVYTEVNWSKEPTFAKALVEKQALDDMDLEALNLADLVAEQVKRLGQRVPTQKAINVFGHVGQHKDFPLFPDAGMSSLPVDVKRPIKQRTLTNMMFEALASVTETAVSSLMIWTFSAIRSIFRLFTVHRILLLFLLWSAVANIFFSYRDSFSWWQERKVSHYMSRIGVKPNTMMSRAIYLEDVNELATLEVGALVNETNECYQSFSHIVQLTDMDAPQDTRLPIAPISRVTHRRLRLSRQTIGVQRHNLLVAMRVINRLEGELMRAEWENWVLDENAHCEKIRWLLDLRQPTSPAGGPLNDTASGVSEIESDEVLREWYDSYCASCRAALETVPLNSLGPSI